MMSEQITKTSNWQIVSCFLNNESQTRQALLKLLSIGIPRDLMEILVEKQNANRIFGHTKIRRPNYAAASAGRGALIGLILFSLISAFLIVSASSRDSSRLTMIMLLGPNVGVLLGAFVGILTGLFIRRAIPPRFERLREGNGVLLVVRTKLILEAESIASVLKEIGADSVKVEAT
jgi:hypothetical protein